MSNHRSAAKRARQTKKKTLRNKNVIQTVRTWEKKIRVAIGQSDKSTAQEMLKTYMSKMAKAAQKGIVKRGTAARKTSRLNQQIDRLS